MLYFCFSFIIFTYNPLLSLPKFDKLAFAQRIIIIQPKEMVKSEFLLFALNSTLVKDDIFRRSTGSTVKGIRSKELVKVKIPVPELGNQEKFTADRSDGRCWRWPADIWRERNPCAAQGF